MYFRHVSVIVIIFKDNIPKRNIYIKKMDELADRYWKSCRQQYNKMKKETYTK